MSFEVRCLNCQTTVEIAQQGNKLKGKCSNCGLHYYATWKEGTGLQVNADPPPTGKAVYEPG